MKLTVLTDNTTRIDAYYLGEPGVSYYLEDGDRRILFDVGYSDVYVRNARTMGVDLDRVDTIVLSHGHNDHTRGLLFLPETVGRVPLITHPDAFCPKRFEGLEIGMPLTRQQAEERFSLHLSREPMAITDRLTYLGQIPRSSDFEAKRPLGERLVDGVWEPDDLIDDSALVYRGEEGLTVITGCSHAGICNITEYAKQVCGDERIVGILGGFHIMKLTSRVGKTVDYLKAQQPKHLCPCHCTCFHARAAIQAVMPTEEVCVGDTLEVR